MKKNENNFLSIMNQFFIEFMLTIETKNESIFEKNLKTMESIF